MNKNKIGLSDHFTYGKLIRFTIPSIAMMIFTSIYGVVDGFFVSNYAGKTAFAAVNLVMPLLMILGTVGFMIGTGGSAIVAKTMGEGDKERANNIFSFLIYTAAVLGVIVAVITFIFLKPILTLMGADGAMMKDCITYGRIVLCSLPMFVLQMAFQSFFVTAEKPDLGLAVTVMAGVTNIVLDAVLVGGFNLGLQGAALATALSETVGGLVPVIYFLRKNDSLLHLGVGSFNGKALLKTCTNGSSELMSNVSMSLVSMLYNIQLMKYIGQDGVSAYGVLMYVNLVFIAVFIGYSIGTAPVISYHFGAENKGELKGLLNKSAAITAVSAVIMFVLAKVFGSTFARIFVGYDSDLMALTTHAFGIFAYSFLFAGFAIFASGFFTALNDGLTSAIISFLRTLVFQVASILILPMLFDIDGIWYSIIVAELMAVVISAAFIWAKGKKYGYR